MNKIKNLFYKLLGIEKVQFLGVLGEQNRTNVYDFQEVVASAAMPEWTEKGVTEWRKFLSQYQYTSSSCVAFTIAKITQVLYFLKVGRAIKFSPGWIYRKRNPKIEGMWIDNAISIAGAGLPTEELYPSEGLTEAQINNLPDLPFSDGVSKEFSISTNWIDVPLDFDTVASTIQKTNKAMMLWFNFGTGEWFRQGTPVVLDVSTPYRHSVCAVDAVKYNGQNYLVIEDSAEVNGQFDHRKLISRSFFDKRCILARYPLSFKYEAGDTKPHYDGSVTSLQDCLKYEGSMASNIPSTGYLGNLTIEATKRFQLEYNIQQTGYVGPITKAKLMELYP